MMKDSYSFDMDAAGAPMFPIRSITTLTAGSLTGVGWRAGGGGGFGGDGREGIARKFMVRTAAGEDQIVSCDGQRLRGEHGEGKRQSCGRLRIWKAEGDGKPLLVHTPELKTIDEVARFLGTSTNNKIKTLKR